MGETRLLVSPARLFARPTADHVWLGSAQQAVLSQLSRPAQLRLLVGPPSSGKTTLLHHWAHTLGPQAVVLKCRGPKDGASAVLASLLIDADLGPWDLSEGEQRKLLTVFVRQRCSQRRRVVILVDDAHMFTAAAREELERLLSFKVDKKPALELVLAGLPSLEKSFSILAEGLAPARVDRQSLPAPSAEDLVSYIDWRLERFEANPHMSPMAAQMIARLSGGRFGAADVLCQMSLLLIRQLGLDRVDTRVVRQAIATLVTRRIAKLDDAGVLPAERPADSPPAAHLIVSRAGKVVTRANLGAKTLIGRSEHNDICLRSPYLSRHHAVIVGTAEGYYLVDLNSANGVHLNGRPVERTVLCDQDVFSIGPFRLKVRIPEWLGQGSPLPDAESLANTVLMGAPEQPVTPVRRVK